VWIKYGSQLINLDHVRSIHPFNTKSGRAEGEVKHYILVNFPPEEPQLWLSVESREKQGFLMEALTEAITAGQRLFVFPKRRGAE